MDLKEFVSQSLIQIIDGVSEAQEHARSKGGYINPALRNIGNIENTAVTNAGQAVQPVFFDVAISVTEDSSSSGGGKIAIANLICVGGKSAESEVNATTSKLSFKINLAIPIDTASLECLKQHEMEEKNLHKNYKVPSSIG